MSNICTSPPTQRKFFNQLFKFKPCPQALEGKLFFTKKSKHCAITFSVLKNTKQKISGRTFYKDFKNVIFDIITLFNYDIIPILSKKISKSSKNSSK